MFSNIPGLYLLNASSITSPEVRTEKNVSRHCHMFLSGGGEGVQNLPELRTMGLEKRYRQ